MTTLMLNFLGSFEAKLDDEVLTRFDTNKSRALLAYLAVESDRAHQRAKLASLFWADWDDSAALKHLRHDLATLRKLLGDPSTETPFLLVTRQTLQFNCKSRYQLDVQNFVEHCQLLKGKPDGSGITPEDIERLTQGLELYKGKFLEGFRLPDCDPFNEWISLTQDRLERTALEVLHTVATYHEERADYSQAISLAYRRVELAPWLEEGYRHLMRLLALDGQRSEAIAQYEKCHTLLGKELNVTPAPETTALYRAIQLGRIPQPAKPTAQGQAKEVTAEQVEEPSHQLPIPTAPTNFVGRSEECKQLRKLLSRDEVRLVTITGVGGMGKTRLSQQTAHSLFELYTDGVYFVPLASVQDPNLVVDTIARILNVRATGARSLYDSIIATIANVDSLLVLDNFEHLLEATSVVVDLLNSCPRLTILTTSREPLRLQGEHEFPIGGLSFPAQEAEWSLEDLGNYSALQLFCEYAQSVRPDFALNEQNKADVAAICRYLDGIPLAIELAAARVRVLSPSAIRKRLGESYEYAAQRLLTSREKDRPPRHQSLWSAIAWSFDLLSHTEQTLFQRMSIFVGGCTLGAIESVCINDDMDMDALDGVTSLLEKHIVVHKEQVDGEPRFIMLETIREFGLTCLRNDRQFSDVRERYTAYFSDLATTLDSELKRANSAVTLHLMDDEIDNLRAAMREATTEVEIEAALQISGILANYWSRRYLHTEGEQWCVRVLEKAKDYPPNPAQARALFTKAFLSASQGNVTEAQTYYERSLAISRKVGPDSTISLSLALLGNNAWDRGDFQQAHAYFDEAQAYIHESDAGWHLAMIRTNQAACYAEQGKLDKAKATLDANWPLIQKVGESSSIRMAQAVEARIDFLSGSLDLAEEKYLAFQKRYADSGSQMSKDGPLSWLAMIWLEKNELHKAHSATQEALAIQVEFSDKRGIVASLCTFALLAKEENDCERVIVLANFIEQFCIQLGYALKPFRQKKLNAAIEVAQAEVSAKHFKELTHWGRMMAVSDAVDYALCQ